VISYVVLGMIGLRGPSTSYDLKRAVGHSVGYFWPFPHAQLYSEPKRLTEMGLLVVSTEQEGRRRQTFSLTPAGRRALQEWLIQPTTEQMQVRDVAELKLFFAELGSEDDVLELAREQARQHQDRIATYEEMMQRFEGRDDVARRLVPLRLGLELEHAALKFWKDLERSEAARMTDLDEDRSAAS
jgi:PadR family transcriptional regulator, regulatory protein AphA